ncbi:hypothetical protein C8R42DRAFT_649087 [Lentinula raphanica]|nr:hypothetical protein C8R42DRAFT_649087 [Lentinula raphanica]
MGWIIYFSISLLLFFCMTLTLKIDGQNMTGYLRLVIFTLIGLLVALDYSLNTTVCQTLSLFDHILSRISVAYSKGHLQLSHDTETNLEADQDYTSLTLALVATRWSSPYLLSTEVEAEVWIMNYAIMPVHIQDLEPISHQMTLEQFRANRELGPTLNESFRTLAWSLVYTDSKRTFTALLKSMIKKKVIGYGRGVLRRNSTPTIYAILLQRWVHRMENVRLRWIWNWRPTLAATISKFTTAEEQSPSGIVQVDLYESKSQVSDIGA